jgi:ABC-2 type transport system ATP-binding protein
LNNEVIRVKDLSKVYKIHEKREGIKNTIKDFIFREYTYKMSVKNINFSIKKGEIVGLIGKNGAGKTTTLKMLSGILYPTSGEVEVLGYKPTKRQKEFLKKISFVMGNKKEINWDLPAIDTFRYQQLIYEIPDQEYNYNLNMMSELLGVKNLLNVQLRRLSLGERMKMELINNFIYSPEVIFLDEPTIGLDLNSQIVIRDFIKKYSKEKKSTIILTSHYMDDIEETCDRIIILENGDKKFDNHISKIKRNDMKFKDIISAMINEGEN